MSLSWEIADCEKMSSPYQAEVTGAGRNILVVVSSVNSQIRFGRSFSSICEVERWLYRLVEMGLRKRDQQYLLKTGAHNLELPPLVSIAVCDKRPSRRFTLPVIFSYKRNFSMVRH